MTQNNTNTNVQPKPATAANPAAEAGSPVDEVREQGAGTDAQMPVEPSKLDNLKSMMSERHPDAEYGSDDDFYAALADDYSSQEKQLGDYRDREERMANLFTRDARSRKFLDNWIDGGDPVVALMREYGDDFREALDDPDKMEEIAQANQEWLKAIAKEKELLAKYEENWEESLNLFDSMEAEGKCEPDVLDDAIAYLREMAGNIIMGKYTPEMIDAALKAKNYDKDVASANYEGEVRGKNSKAEMKLRKPADDNMPHGGKRSGAPTPQRPQLPGALGREKKSIWETGEIKRTPARG